MMSPAIFKLTSRYYLNYDADSGADLASGGGGGNVAYGIGGSLSGGIKAGACVPGSPSDLI